MQRFFIPAASIVDASFVLRNPETIHQIRKVLRMRAGAQIILLDNSGWEFVSEIVEIPSALTPHFSGGEIKLKILEKRENRSEAPIAINLFQALPNAISKFEEILKHATEVGVASFHPIICERSELQKLKNRERLEKILKEASEQSGRGKFPLLAEITKFKAVWENLPSGMSLIGDSFSSQPLLCEILPALRAEKVLNLFVGGEGGFSEKEVATAKTNGAIPFSLGKRILRCETAGVAIASAILFT